jgi:lactoylglutathione lyase
VRTLHVGLRVAHRERSIAFYRSLGYEVVGEVPGTSLGHLTMLKLPGDEFVSLELVSGAPGTVVGRDDRLSHVVIQVGSMDDALARAGVQSETGGANDGNEVRTAWITDPDGNRIELVQWPPGHPDGLTAADWPAIDAG